MDAELLDVELLDEELLDEELLDEDVVDEELLDVEVVTTSHAEEASDLPYPILAPQVGQDAVGLSSSSCKSLMMGLQERKRS